MFLSECVSEEGRKVINKGVVDVCYEQRVGVLFCFFVNDIVKGLMRRQFFVFRDEYFASENGFCDDLVLFVTKRFDHVGS